MIKTAALKPRPFWQQWTLNFLNRSGLLVALVILFLLLSAFAPRFLTQINLFNILRAVAANGIVACAMTLVIISGDIDVSVGSAMAWSSSLLGVLAITHHWPLLLAVAFVLAMGTLVHMLLGLIRIKWNIPAFVVTLTLMLSYKGAAKVITNAYPVTPFPDSFSFWGQGYIAGIIPVPAVIMLLFFALFYLISNRTVFGRSVYAVGGNEEAARLSGIPVWRTRLVVFAISGLLAALCGVIISSRIMSGAYNVGEGLEFEVIAAVVIGGTSLNGGVGSMIGSCLGVLFIGLISNGMTLMGFHPYWQEVVRGLITLVAVLTSVLQKPVKNER